jgi:hypothetical protein
VEVTRRKYFIGACILGAALLFKAGAPPFAIVMGIVLAAFLNWMRERRAVCK